MRKFSSNLISHRYTDFNCSWTAICRGAVLKGMSDETVVNHIAKYHYGIHFQEKYDVRKHEEQDKVWDMVECEWKAYHQMRWYISRVSIPKSHNISHADDSRATTSPKQSLSATTGTKPSPTVPNWPKSTPQSTTALPKSHPNADLQVFPPSHSPTFPTNIS